MPFFSPNPESCEGKYLSSYWPGIPANRGNIVSGFHEPPYYVGETFTYLNGQPFPDSCSVAEVRCDPEVGVPYWYVFLTGPYACGS